MSRIRICYQWLNIAILTLTLLRVLALFVISLTVDDGRMIRNGTINQLSSMSHDLLFGESSMVVYCLMMSIEPLIRHFIQMHFYNRR